MKCQAWMIKVKGKGKISKCLRKRLRIFILSSSFVKFREEKSHLKNSFSRSVSLS